MKRTNFLAKIAVASDLARQQTTVVEPPTKWFPPVDFQNGQVITDIDGQRVPVKFGIPNGSSGGPTPYMGQSRANEIAQALMFPTPVEVGPSLFMSYGLLTPGIGRLWLDKFSAINRDVLFNHVRELLDDIGNNLWWLTHQSFAFDQNGMLGDGQHRAGACVMANIAIPTLISINVCTCALQAVDLHRRRSASAAAAIAGDDIDRRLEAVVRRILEGIGDGGHKAGIVTPLRILQYTEVNKPALDWVMEQFGQTHVVGVSVAPVKAAVYKAYLHCQRDEQKVARLAQFVQVVRTMRTDDANADRAAVRLHALLSGENMKYKDSPRIELVAQKAVKFFLQGRPIENLKLGPKEGEFFPLDKDCSSPAA